MPAWGEAAAQGPPEAAVVPGWERKTGVRLAATYPPSAAMARAVPISWVPPTFQGTAELCGTVPSTPQCPREGLGALQHLWGSEGADGMSPWTAKGDNSPLPSSTGWWGKAGGQDLFPRRGDIHGHLGGLGSWEREQEMRGTGG